MRRLAIVARHCGHEVRAARQMGWSAIRNGEMLALAAQAFDVFVTVDRNLSFQQNVSALALAVVVLRAKTNRLADLRPLVPDLLKALATARTGEVAWVGNLAP